MSPDHPAPSLSRSAGTRRSVRRSLIGLALLSPLGALAGPEDDLRSAIDALFRSSYAWETTTRQRFGGESTEPRVNPNAPIETRGRFNAEGYTQATLLASRAFPVAVTAVTRQSDTVTHTPLGWLRRAKIHQSGGPDREIEFEGRRVRLSRALSTALVAAAIRTPTDELADVLADMKTYRTHEGLILIELRDRTVEKLWGDGQAKRAPEIQGTVIVKLGEGGVTEYHYVLAIGFPNDRTKKVAWQSQQWTTRISGIGTTAVDPPAEAVKALED